MIVDGSFRLAILRQIYRVLNNNQSSNDMPHTHDYIVSILQRTHFE